MQEGILKENRKGFCSDDNCRPTWLCMKEYI